MKMVRLDYDWRKEAWVCQECGAEYKRSYFDKPSVGWCMKCKCEWCI